MHRPRLLRFRGRHLAEVVWPTRYCCPHSEFSPLPPEELVGTALGSCRILHLELAHGALSHNISSVERLIEVAAEKALTRVGEARARADDEGA